MIYQFCILWILWIILTYVHRNVDIIPNEFAESSEALNHFFFKINKIKNNSSEHSQNVSMYSVIQISWTSNYIFNLMYLAAVRTDHIPLWDIFIMNLFCTFLRIFHYKPYFEKVLRFRQCVCNFFTYDFHLRN